MRSIFFLSAGLFFHQALWAQIPIGAVAAYPFCGNANDMIGTNNGLVVGASLTADRFGNANQAYYFNGQPGCYINLGTSSVLKPVKGSVSVWARPDGFSSVGSGYLLNPIIITKNQPGNNCYEGYSIGLATVNNPPQFHGVITQPFCNQSYAFYTGVNYQNWYHLVLTWTIDSIKLYVNGTLSQVNYKGFTSTYLAGDSVMVGNTANVQNDRFFLGAIDDIYIYPHALSQTEVTQLYNASWNCSAGMNNLANADRISIFPNPVSDGRLQVNGLPVGTDGKIFIYNMSGEILLECKAASSVELGELPAGLYFFIYRDKNATVSRKLVITR